MTRQDGLEERLREALRREEAPAGFAERVLAKARALELSEPWWRRWMRVLPVGAMRYATAVVLILVVVLGTLGYRRREQEKREGEFARQQLLLALRIASKKLQYAQAKVSRTGEQNISTEGRQEQR